MIQESDRKMCIRDRTEAERKGYFVMLIGGEKIEDVVDMASRWNVEGLIILGYDEERRCV